ncbi:hypothetical protein KVV02_001255 [Mortierella alpina]|uniref:Bromo domain-containing protein n=1 Tax=Mortierella alpina TaxID=64518 RepID=A0A9P8A0M9_MORAP|nr:hypothetical protein KVV02_001255 [Mortierella alpina]
MDRDQMSEGSTPSANDDAFPLKRTISTSNSDPRLNPEPTSARADATPLEHSYLDTDTNDSKRRKIQDHTALGQTQTIDASNSVAGIHHGSTAVRSTREYSFSDIQDDPRAATAATTITAITTTTALSIERPSLDAHESEPGPRTLEPRRSVKRVNYADPEDSIEEDEDDQIHQEDTLSSRRRTQSRTSLRSRPPLKQNASEDEGDDDEPSDKSGQGKPEQDSAAFGPRTLRDRRSITAPKPFPIGNPNPPASRIRRPDGGRRTGRRHYEESDNIYRSSSRSLAPKRPPPTPRQITENMRITRGMSGSLMDSPNSRDVTPDRPSRQNGRSGSRFHHGISSDEEQDLDEGDGRGDEDEEDDDEEMEEGEADIEVASSLNNQEDNGLIRMTRLRARNQAQPAISSIHSSQRSSRPKSTHSRSQQEADRKYDLRERPKNRPTYIADRPIPSPTRPRTSRMSSYGGRDPFSRPRQNRPSLFDALRRAGVSSSDDEIPTFKRRSGTAESRGSSSRILPMNMHELADSRRDVIASRVGQLADTDPLAVGNSVDFDKVGGLDHHIYESNEKLQIDASTIVVEEIDLLKSAKSLTPASYRVTGATASPLPINIAPLLKDQFSNICKAVDGLFSGASKHPSRGNSNDDDDDTAFQAMGYRSFEKLKTFRPRMLVAGERGMGQRYIGPALLHYLEGCTVQQFDLAALMSESSRTPEAACVQFFIEVKRHAPSIIYIPHIDAWWSVVSEAVKATFSNLLDDLSPEDGILFLATSETPLEALPIPIRRWFLSSPKSRIGMSKPSASSRALFFEALLSDLARPPTDFKVRKVELAQLEQLKKAPPPQPRVPTTEEKKLLREHDEYVLRELRISLRTVVDELFKERKFKPFFRPVEPEEFPDYYDIVKKPMDLTTVSDKINDFMYLDVKEFLSDIDLIADNTRLYNDIHDPSRIIYRARDLQDVAHAMISRLDPELILETEKTAARRRQEARAHQRPQGERISRRRLGLEAPAVPDDPEMYLRNRTVMSKLLLDATVREESADISVKVEGGQTVEEDYEQPSNMVEDLNDGSRYHDGEESGTSLSMPPSVAASVAASSIPPTPTVSVTPGPLPASTSLEVGSMNGKMDVDSPRQSQEGPEVAMGNGPDALTSYTEDYIDDGKEAAMSISPAATSLVAAVDAAAASADVTDTKEMADGTLTPLGKDESSQPAQEDTLDVQEETKEAEEEEPMEMLLEQHDVAGLQAVLVQDTEGSSVEELDQLRAALYEIIWEHRLEWDKSPMLLDMRETLAFMTVLRMESEQGPDLRSEHHFD